MQDTGLASRMSGAVEAFGARAPGVLEAFAATAPGALSCSLSMSAVSAAGACMCMSSTTVKVYMTIPATATGGFVQHSQDNGNLYC